MKISLPLHVKKCIQTIENAGFEAFCVGGAVRDLISGMKQPFDFDVATNCHPKNVAELFERVIPTGIKHGTVTVLIDGTPIEVTTYRTECGYTDARHPDKVSFIGDIKEDLARRDFTVNAIAYNEKAGIFDPFDGQKDIERKILRTVGEPDRRFSEDALRIMRLFRFSSQLGFEIEEESEKSAVLNADSLKQVSAERIASELFKMLEGAHLKKARLFFEKGFLSYIGLRECSIESVAEIETDILARFSAICIVSNSDADALCRALKTEKAFKNNAIFVCDMIKSGAPETRADIKKYLSQYGIENFKSYIKTVGIVCEGDSEFLKAELESILICNEPYLVSHLAIGGDELNALGISGRAVGRTLEKLKNAVIENPALNTKESLINLITK